MTFGVGLLLDAEEVGDALMTLHNGEKEKVSVPCDSSVLTLVNGNFPITNIGGLWFVSKGFGTTFVCTDLLVKPAEKRKGDFVGLGMQRSRAGPRREQRLPSAYWKK